MSGLSFDAVIDMVAFAPENAESLLRAFTGRVQQIVVCSTVCVYGGPMTKLPAADDDTILLTTHILEEADRCDRLVLLHQGNIVAQGSPNELRSSIGGDVVVLSTADSQSLAANIGERFHLKTSERDGEVRVEIENGHRFIAEVVEAFPGAVNSVGLHKPTLEDVFVRQTGASIE
jgi:ABC-type multidrug transport system ATPase subunit